MQAHALLYTDRRHDGQCSPTRRAPVENFGEELLAPIKTKYIKQCASSGLDVLEESSNDIASNTKSNNDIIEKTIKKNNIINDNEISTEILSGLTVALATVPTSIAYATIVGISPLLGIWTSILIGGIVGLTLSITPNAIKAPKVLVLGNISSSAGANSIMPLKTE